MDIRRMKKFIVVFMTVVLLLSFVIPSFNFKSYIAATIYQEATIVSETTAKRPHGFKIENVEYWDYTENYDKKRIWIDQGGSGSGESGGAFNNDNSRDETKVSISQIDYPTTNSQELTIETNDDITKKMNKESIKENIESKLNNDRNAINREKNSKNGWINSIINSFRALFNSNSHSIQQKQEPYKNNKYLKVLLPITPITLTSYRGGKIEIISFDNKIERSSNGRCDGTIYYRVRKLSDKKFEFSSCKIKLIDEGNFVPESYENFPDTSKINIGEVTEGNIQFSSIPYSDSYKLVIETK